MKKLYSIVIMMIVFICFTSVAAAKDAQRIQEISTFYNGTYQLSSYQSIMVDKSKTYVPLKLIDTFSDISVAYGSDITVKTGKGSFKIDKRNTIIHNNTTYITYKKLQEMSHVTGKYVGSAQTLFLWDNSKGQAKSGQLISNISTLTNDYRAQFGKKIYNLSDNRAGWIVDIVYSSYSTTTVKVMHKDYSISEMHVLSAYNDQYILDEHLQIIESLNNSTVWINKNVLDADGLKHLEKVYIHSATVKNQHLNINVKRQNGTYRLISIKIESSLGDSLDGIFYYENPKTHFKWSAKVWEDITNRVIRTGMTQAQVIMAWGYPDDANSTSTTYSEWEQWIYNDTDYLHFSDGILVSISEY
ncbi:hypothetical protein [Paenibacillus agilis]|uniref:Copper amine oxidase-like N-terminal domain-containing protein n=1 Tax=Paenibacillus agilis TaxID=3020863 RepID=A0A559IHX5_9BACL|nr:hypothetical protein [Paenibacillus agilis]TVX87110.1 hypothetical protein FPZ44_21700 [Paenibacillus agilis]